MFCCFGNMYTIGFICLIILWKSNYVHSGTSSDCGNEQKQNTADKFSMPFGVGGTFKLTREEVEMKSRGYDLTTKCLKILFNNEGWESVDSEEVIDSKVYKGRKIYRAQAFINAPPDIMLVLLYDHFEREHQWNLIVHENRIIKKLENTTDVVFTLRRPICKRLVSPRSFVLFRAVGKFTTTDQSMVISSESTDEIDIPVNNTVVKGEYGPNCYVITPVNKSECTELRWLFNIDEKGWLPDRARHESIVHFIRYFIHSLRECFSGTSTGPNPNRSPSL